MQHHRNGPAATISAEKCFGKVLREIRKEKDFTQEELAFESGYHPTYIGQLERGKKSPSLRAIMRLANALNTPASEILRRVETAL
jgi:transcriptional regulator with XRE-family HTH domain